METPWLVEALVCVGLVKCRTLLAVPFDPATIITRIRAWMELNEAFGDEISEPARSTLAALIGFVIIELAHKERKQQRWN